MKSYTGFFLSAVLLCAAMSPALEVGLEPVRRNVQMGKFIQLQLSSDKRITKIDTPEVSGAQWENSYSSSGMRSINGKVTYTRTLMLIPSQEGTVTIPPFRVHAGKESALTKEIRIRVLPRSAGGGGEVKIADVVKGKVSIAGKKKSYYAGEELVIHCDLLIDERFMTQIRANYLPELLNTGNAVFTLYNYRGGRIRFQLGTPSEVVEKENVFICHRFTARCRVLIPGTFAPGATIRLGIVRKNAVEEDDFFGGFGFGGGLFSTDRVMPYTLKFTPAPPVEIKALPPLPAGVTSCGLVGQWQISGALSSKSLRQGEVAELELKFKGEGALENFKAPELQFPGFRLYPPEVQKKKNEITAKYALIPLESGEKVLELTPVSFSPVQNKWVGSKIEFKAAVAPGKTVTVPAVQKNFGTSVAAKGSKERSEVPATAGQQLLYQKNAPGAVVELPLIRNNLFLLLFFIFGMPVAAAGIELYFRRREKENAAPELSAKRRRRKALAALAAELRRKGDTPEFRQRLIPILGESMGLSAGASAGDLARQVEDPELCRYFAGIESSSYIPGGTSGSVLSEGTRKALLRLLKKYSLVLICFACFSGVGGAELNQEFNRGEFAKASLRYLDLAGNDTGYRPAMLYNYGNSRYYLNDLPEARWALNLAHLLAPGDGEIRANLEHVNSRLFENASAPGSLRGFLRGLRDHFRCDQYLLFGSFCWGLLWMVWSFRRKLGPGLFYGSGGALIFVIVVCLLSCGGQLNENYSPRRIIITQRSAELRTLPGFNAGSTESTLRGGSEGELIQRDSSGFCRVRINGREGWLPETSFKRAFPGKLF